MECCGDRMRLIALVSLILIVSIAPVSGAVIRGEIYSWELKRVKAIVEINTTPKQRIVALNGSYEFEVPLGVYEIRAYSIDGNLFCNETVVIKNNGTYVIDLILFPKLENNLSATELNFSLEEKRSETPLYVGLTLTFLAFLVALIFIKKRKRKGEIPDDLEVVLELIRKSGGRITQKELREKLGWSEAKLSLVLTDLERRGLIEKYRKGRGNVVFLKD